MRHVVATADEIAPGGRKRLVVDGRAIVVFNVAGRYYALADTCPHRGASLAGGKLTGRVESDGPGSYRISRIGEIIRCPWHAWEFDITTGRSTCDPRRMRAMAYPVSVAAGAALVEGPYTAATFPVRVEGRYVVVEVG